MEEISIAELLHRLEELEEMTHCALGLAIAAFIALLAGCLAYSFYYLGQKSNGGEK